MGKIEMGQSIIHFYLLMKGNGLRNKGKRKCNLLNKK